MEGKTSPVWLIVIPACEESVGKQEETFAFLFDLSFGCEWLARQTKKKTTTHQSIHEKPFLLGSVQPIKAADSRPAADNTSIVVAGQ